MYKMKGVIPPMITPFKEDGQLDKDSLAKLVDYLSNQVHGLFITGSYGSGVLMSTEERKQVAEITMKTDAGRIPVIVHVGTADSASAAELAKHAQSIGADAVSAVGPFYYTHNDDSIVAYYDEILKATGGDFPVYVYNNPGFQGYPMSLELLKRLKKLGVHGIKDATFSIIEHTKYARVLKDENFDLASGTEAMWLSASALGTEAFIPGMGNALPEICCQMYEESQAKDYEKLRVTQFEVNELRDIMYLAKSTQLAVYAMLEIRGIIKAYPRSPFIPASEEEKQAIKVRLESLGII